MKKIIGVLALVVVLAGVAIYQFQQGGSGTQTASANEKPKPGYNAPILQLPDLNDKQTTIGGPRSELSVVNFWASWCGPCEEEAPDLKALASEYAGKLEFFAVNATSYDKERQAREFVDQQQFKFPVLMDRDGVATDAYKVASFPTSFIIDKHGVVRERIPGIISRKEWEAMLDKWLKAAEQEEETAGRAANANANAE